MHFFDEHTRFFESSRVGTLLPDGTRSDRLRYRHEAIIERNRALYQGARVLDLASHDGRWSLAALDAGAVFVLGIEGRERYVSSANENFAAYNVSTEQYKFIQGDVPSAMAPFDAESFDIILCLGLFYHTISHYQFFHQIFRLKPRYVILDTVITDGDGPLVRYKYEHDDDEFGTLRSTEGLPRSVIGIPSGDMIAMLCDHFRFDWKIIDWKTFGIERWDGMTDYEKDERRTYVLTNNV